MGLVIYLCILASVLFAGMVGDKSAENRRNFVYAFCVCIIAATAAALKIM